MKVYIPVDIKKELPGDYTIYRLEGEILSKRDVYHGKVREVEITEEEIREVLSKRTRTYAERDNESGEQYPILAVPSHLFKAIARDIRNLLKAK